MKPYKKLLLENKAWAQEKVQDDPDFFSRLEHLQSPEYLWIGCSDSRVPANEITNTQPGEIFVHRNIANLVVNTDVNLLSVLQYAVEVLKVKHIIVCGHYGCGGVKAAMTNNNFNHILNIWLRNIKDVFAKNRPTLEAIKDDGQRFDKLVELNVIDQVKNLSKTSIVQRAWKNGEELQLHGWVYRLSDGLINPIYELENNDEVDPIFVYEDL